MSDLNQFSLEDDDCNDMFITQESSKDGYKHNVEDGESAGIMEIENNCGDTGVFDMGNSLMYSDISDEECTEKAVDEGGM